MSKSNQRLRLQRIRLWKEDPHCYHCGLLTELPPKKAHLKNKPHYATIDHLYSRYDPRRYAPMVGKEKRRVLACFACNQKRSIQETAALPKEELWRRSGRYPRSENPKLLNEQFD